MDKWKKRILFSILKSLILIAACASIIYRHGTMTTENRLRINTEKQVLEKERQEKETRKKTKEESGIIDYIPSEETLNELDQVITEKSDALEVLKKLQYDLGIRDAKKEYEAKEVQSYKDHKIYEMQQYHNRIEVYGTQLKVITDQEGNLERITGKYENLDGFSAKMSLSESDALKCAEKYLESEAGYASGEVCIRGHGGKIAMLNGETPVVSYLFEVTDQNGKFPLRRLFVDGNTGEIISDNSMELSRKV